MFSPINKHLARIQTLDPCLASGARHLYKKELVSRTFDGASRGLLISPRRRGAVVNLIGDQVAGSTRKGEYMKAAKTKMLMDKNSVKYMNHFSLEMSVSIYKICQNLDLCLDLFQLICTGNIPERFNAVVSYLTYAYSLKLISIGLHMVIFEPGT